jgi:hypothetical protein
LSRNGLLTRKAGHTPVIAEYTPPGQRSQTVAPASTDESQQLASLLQKQGRSPLCPPQCLQSVRFGCSSTHTNFHVICLSILNVVSGVVVTLIRNVWPNKNVLTLQIRKPWAIPLTSSAQYSLPPPPSISPSHLPQPLLPASFSLSSLSVSDPVIASDLPFLVHTSRVRVQAFQAMIAFRCTCNSTRSSVPSPCCRVSVLRDNHYMVVSEM